MTRQLARRSLTDRSHHGESQEASLRAGANQPFVYITRKKMEIMMEAMQEQMLKRENEMMQNFFRQIGQAGAVEAVGVQNQGLGAVEAAGNLDYGVGATGVAENQNQERGTETTCGGMQRSNRGRTTGMQKGSAPIPLEGSTPIP